jgi:hypothetical protein
VQPFAMLLKSYSGDFEYAKRLIESFTRFNSDGITLYLVVPESDQDLFSAIIVENTKLISENALAQHLVDHEVHGIRPGYINQEIIKLAFWELGLSANYFCVDSDAEFIREFHVSDFMHDSDTPYSVLVQDLELAVDPEYYQQYWVTREREIARIAELIGWESQVINTCHGHTVFSGKVLESFVREFLQPRGWDYSDALAESPYEFTWYNMWLQKSRVIDIYPREPWIKVFHTESQHLEYLMRGISVADIARGYFGVVVNSNYSRGSGIVSAGNSKPANLAQYLSYREMIKLIRHKVASTVTQAYQIRK